MFFFKPVPGKQHWQRALKLRDPYRKDYDLQEAINHFKRAILDQPNNHRYHFDLGRTYLNTPHLAATRGVNVSFPLDQAVKLAIEEFKKAITLNPSFDSSYLNLAHCYVIEGNKTEALAAYTGYLKLTKQKIEEPAPPQLPEPDPKKKKKQRPPGFTPDERLQNMEYAIMKRRKIDAEPQKAEEHLQNVVRYRNEGKYKKAAKALEQAYTVAPDVPWVYKRLYKIGK